MALRSLAIAIVGGIPPDPLTHTTRQRSYNPSQSVAPAVAVAVAATQCFVSDA
ncbi:hypothetical protein GCM10007907_17420 [Chitinimonas prasina]|uniref:Cellulase n=1 Tax=Chitinimonas prasina TaxID=1434937 RepID=A0ABQ5YEQ3_9NEIS|nr:hypothetical protein [Chitinimonas prasina]GLR12952.1 hypothetical protein GCM10007907_17420 [Chitinimonas prasina]